MRKKIEPTKIENTYTPWKLDLPKSWTGTRRIRKYFATREEADAWLARAKMDGWRNAETRKRAGGGGRSGASDAGEVGTMQGVEDKGQMRVAELCAVFIGRNAGKSAATVRQLRYVLGSLEERLGRMPVARVTHREIDEWLMEFTEGATRHNHYRIGRRVFEFALNWLEIIPKNPFRKISRPETRKPGGKIEILTAEEFGQALGCAEAMQEPQRSRWIAYLALGGLAGLRTEEIFYLRWEDVRIPEKEIYVRQPKRARGWHPRYVRALPRFLEVWALAVRPKPVGRAGGKFAVSAEKVLPGGQRELYTIRREAMNALGWARWPQNCLRHSYATYHLAEFKNLAELRGELGHESESVTRRHYATAARGVDAAAWWRGEENAEKLKS